MSSVNPRERQLSHRRINEILNGFQILQILECVPSSHQYQDFRQKDLFVLFSTGLRLMCFKRLVVISILTPVSWWASLTFWPLRPMAILCWWSRKHHCHILILVLKNNFADLCRCKGVNQKSGQIRRPVNNINSFAVKLLTHSIDAAALTLTHAPMASKTFHL